MADELQGTPGTESQATAAETTPPVAAPEAAPVAPGAAEPTATPNPVPEAKAPVDWDKVDAGAYKDLKEKFLAGELPGEPAVAPVPETAPQAPSTEAAAAPAVEPTPPVDDEPKFGKNFRPRLGTLPKVAQEAIQLVRELHEQGQEIDLGEAERRVKAKYGLDAAPATQAAPAAPAQSTSDLQASIERMESELDAAGKEADTDKIASLTKELRKADRDLRSAQETERAAAAHEAKSLTDAKDDVRKRYPDFKDPKSALSIKFGEIYDQLESEQSGILQLSPAKQMATISQMAAAELGQKPVDPNAPAAVPKAPAPALPNPSAQPPVQPASGALRTATPSNPSANIQQRIDSVKTMDDYETLKAQALQLA